MTEGIERLILASLVHDEAFFITTMPHLKQEYFEEHPDQEIFKAIKNFNDQYSKRATIDSLFVDIEASKTITEDSWVKVQQILDYMSNKPEVEPLWRIKETENWAKDQAVFLAAGEVVDIIQSGDRKKRGEITELWEEALNVNFDNKVGIEYGLNPEDQYEYYHSPESLIKTDLSAFNLALKGGLRRKTLSVLMSNKTGGFKSGTMCHFSAAAQSAGYNVLYITLELHKKEIIRRVDANLIDTPLDDIKKIGRQTYINRIKKIKENLTGRLIVQEYPPTSAHSGHFRFLLKELESKQKFKPDLICVDYLNICASSRFDPNRHNSYTVIKAIAEELRAISMEYDCAILTGTQSGRQGVKAGTKIDLDDVSDSYGLPATADVMFSIIDTEETSQQNILVYKQLKNRFGDININPFFKVGVEKAKMRLYDVDNEWEDEQKSEEEKPTKEVTWANQTKLKKDKFDFG